MDTLPSDLLFHVFELFENNCVDNIASSAVCCVSKLWNKEMCDVIIYKYYSEIQRVYALMCLPHALHLKKNENKLRICRKYQHFDSSFSNQQVYACSRCNLSNVRQVGVCCFSCTGKCSHKVKNRLCKHTCNSNNRFCYKHKKEMYRFELPLLV